MIGRQDGLVKWWDIRNFGRSFREFVVTAGDGQEGGGGGGVSCMGYEATIPRLQAVVMSCEVQYLPQQLPGGDGPGPGHDRQDPVQAGRQLSAAGLVAGGEEDLMNYDRLGCCRESFKIPLAGNQSIQIFLYYLQCHTSKILAVERNPFYPKYFLTIGGYTSKVGTINL